MNFDFDIVEKLLFSFG